MAPNIGGFHKRNDFVESPDHPTVDSTQPAEEPKAFINGNFKHLFENVDGGSEQRRRPDDHARSMYDAVQAEIKEFLLSDESKTLSRWAKVKLGFSDSDILKNVSVRSRWCEYSETYASGLAPEMRLPVDRDTFNVFEMAYGVRAWLRQLQWHILFYKWYDAFGQSASDRGLHRSFEGAAKPLTRVEKLVALGESSYAMHLILARVGHEGTNSSTNVYNWIRNEKAFQQSNKYQLVQETCTRLISMGLVDKVDAPSTASEGNAGSFAGSSQASVVVAAAGDMGVPPTASQLSQTVGAGATGNVVETAVGEDMPPAAVAAAGAKKKNKVKDQGRKTKHSPKPSPKKKKFSPKKSTKGCRVGRNTSLLCKGFTHIY